MNLLNMICDECHYLTLPITDMIIMKEGSKKTLMIVGGVLVTLTIGLGIYAYRNLTYDYMNSNFMEKKRAHLVLMRSRW